MEGGEISGNYSITANSRPLTGGVYVGSYGNFTMQGGIITGNAGGSGAGTENGAGGVGGVYVAMNGVFTMTGGNISANTGAPTNNATNYAAGGVYLANAGTLSKTGGLITGVAGDSTDDNKAIGTSITKKGNAVYWDRAVADGGPLKVDGNVSASLSTSPASGWDE
jgi:hypothetical protein